MMKSQVSYAYYRSGEETTTAAGRNVGESLVTVKKITLTQSKHLPRWLWLCIAKMLGIAMYPDEKPWLATVLHMLTCLVAATNVGAHAWITFVGIMNKATNSTSSSSGNQSNPTSGSQEDALNGSFGIVVGLFWCSLGIYANKLAYRLFRHIGFQDSIRLHSKSVFRCNASLLIALLGSVFIVMNDYQCFMDYRDQRCTAVQVEAFVCKLMFTSRVTFSIFATIWNLMVAFVLMSVCRTHTIGIRRFIRDLERDAATFDQYYSRKYLGKQPQVYNMFDEYIWIDDDEEYIPETMEEQEEASTEHASSSWLTPCTWNANWKPDALSPISETSEPHTYNDPSLNENGEDFSRSTSSPVQRIVQSTVNRKDISKPNDETVEDIHTSEQLKLLSSEEILHRYWKISGRLRLTSSALQRWMVCFLSICVIWVGMYLAYWLSHPATVIDVIQFIIPLFLMPLITSAYAEVNNEGMRMLKFLCPTANRFQMLSYLSRSPMQMVAYGFPVTYSTIVTVVFAMIVAFTSRIILTELRTQ